MDYLRQRNIPEELVQEFYKEAPIDLMSFIALYPNDWKM